METAIEKGYCSERLRTGAGRWCVGDVEGGCLDCSLANNSEKEGELASPVYTQAESLL